MVRLAKIRRYVPLIYTLGIMMPTSTAYGGTLTVHITNVQSTDGKVNLAVYPKQSAKSFPYKGNMNFFDTETKQVLTDLTSKPAMVGTVSFVVEVPDDTYALAAYQDINNDGKMNLFLGIPREPYGFSNDAKGTLLPPSFEKASFQVQGDTTVTFQIAK